MNITSLTNKLAGMCADLMTHEGEAAALAETIREQVPSRSAVFDNFRIAAESGSVDAMTHALDIAGVLVNMTSGVPLDVEPLRWAARHPDELDALADLYEAQRDLHDRELAQLAEYRAAVEGVRAEAERRKAERERTAHDLPDIIADLEARIRELEGETE